LGHKEILLFQRLFGTFLKLALFFETAKAVTKIGLSVKTNYQREIYI